MRTPILEYCTVWVSQVAFAREPGLCSSVTDVVFSCALLLFLTLSVCCEVLFVFWCTFPME